MAKGKGKEKGVEAAKVADGAENVGAEYRKIEAERDSWRKQALEENAALDAARNEVKKLENEVRRLKSYVSDLKGGGASVEVKGGTELDNEPYKFGEVIAREFNMAKARIKEAHEKWMPKDLKGVEISVMVFNNGRMLFHGGQTLGVKEYDQIGMTDVKNVAKCVLMNMADGKCPMHINQPLKKEQIEAAAKDGAAEAAGASAPSKGDAKPAPKRRKRKGE